MAEEYYEIVVVKKARKIYTVFTTVLTSGRLLNGNPQKSLTGFNQAIKAQLIKIVRKGQ